MNDLFTGLFTIFCFADDEPIKLVIEFFLSGILLSILSGLKHPYDHYMTAVIHQSKHTDRIKAPAKIPVFSQNHLEFRVWNMGVSNMGSFFTLSLFQKYIYNSLKTKGTTSCINWQNLLLSMGGFYSTFVSIYHLMICYLGQM